MPTATCAHGFAPGTCLICQTLGTGTAMTKAPAKPASGVHVLPAPRRRLTLGTRLLGLTVVVVAAVLALWWLVAAAAAVLHLAELLAMGAVTGWVGWRLGVRHGRHLQSIEPRRH